MNNIVLEALGVIFTIDDGQLKLLLLKNNKEPYKGYWVLPGGNVSKDVTIDAAIEKHINSQVGLEGLSFEQCSVFSDINRVPSKRVIAVSLMSIVDEYKVKSNNVKTNYEYSWFTIDKLPKIGYDHSKVIEVAVNELKNKLNQSHTLQQIFPSDFTLPEIQRVYEQVLAKELDRRNFRKKFFKFDLIEETGDKAPSLTGRPAKLYRFKTDIENVILF